MPAALAHYSPTFISVRHRAAFMTVSPLKIQSCVVLLLLAGCASVPPPTAALAEAEARIAMAREQRAARYVPADLDAAEATLQAAREAMAHEDYTLAQQQADEALVQEIGRAHVGTP